MFLNSNEVKYDITMLNDKSAYNMRYRHALILSLNASGHRVRSLGIFDSWNLIATFYLILFVNRTDLIIASNIKTNILCLFLIWRKRVQILNGLGRMRASRTFRLVLMCAMKLGSKNALFYVQNYADYRYLKRFSTICERIYWSPGSGGTKRLVSTESSIGIISRPTKLRMQLASIRKFMEEFPEYKQIKIIGVEEHSLFDDQPYKVDCLGYLEQSKIFESIDSLVIPVGYGEGVPHVLVDGIQSGVNVFIQKIDVIRFGLRRLYDLNVIEIRPGWFTVRSKDGGCTSISADTIVAQIKSGCDRLNF